MLFRPLIAAALAAAIAAPVPAQERAAEAPPSAEADAVFSLRNVESLAFDSGRDGLFAIADGRLMHWSLFPLTLKASLQLDTLASDLAVSPRGALFLAGQRWNPDSLLLLGGSILAFPVDSEAGIKDWVRLYMVPDNAVGISQFSSVDFDDSGRAYFGSPVSFLLLVLPDDLAEVVPGTERRTFELSCGASAQLSVFEAEDQVFYFSSTIEGAALEFGRMAGPDEKAPRAECFRVANIYEQKASPATFYSVRHAVITRPAAEADGAPSRGVLVLEPNNGRLYFFEVGVAGGELLISRARSTEIDLAQLGAAEGESRTGSFGLLAASGDGTEIYVSGTSMRRVWRFGVDAGGKLVERGMFDLPAPAQAIEIAEDGRYAAFVTGENRFGAERVLTILDHPGKVPEGAPLPASLRSVRLLQELLNAAGFDAGRVDGIFGPRTIEAVQAYIEALERMTNGDALAAAVSDQGAVRGGVNLDPLRGLVESVFPRRFAQ
ncbi:peptidoglycan-binding domain-containing protein [Rhodovulum euryhalinum]|uniref:Putative peptidoglycan binding protein n=1 Tax=Rhodovulum euryhalinum TaxID=35805 RepID=A0A4R2KCY7_9RHOB|nr:peptidoglycan-binding domain-containing protein [Rhodovulum euryhalinum]TCO70784.1 putative peptidoglycan binding protein [Rhodovulum euryhalinum]